MSASVQSSAAYQDNVFPIFDTASASPALSQNRVRIPSLNSGWFSQLNNRFNDLATLPVGWDGYAGQPVSFDCLLFAANLIERLFIDGVDAPQIVPGSDGTLQIEWHENQFDIEIDILAPYKVVATRYDLLADTDQEFELESDFSCLAEWIEDLKQDRYPEQSREA